MKILIVDDEPLARSRLQDLLDDIGGHNVIGEASNGEQALSQIEEHHPDLVLLDIHMPGIDGLDVAKKISLKPSPPAVIFTTAYSEHALKAFDNDAIDYLLKPIRQARLEQALCKVSPHVTDKSDTTRHHISAQVLGSIKLIPIEDIYYFQSDSKYVVVYHRGGEVLIDDSLKSLEQEFSDHFTRIHRNALVADVYIEGLEKIANGQFQLRLVNCPTPLEVSRRQLPSVRKIIARL